MWRLQYVKDIISGTAHGHNEVEAFNNLLQVMNLNDCWREMNKETKVFTSLRKTFAAEDRTTYFAEKKLCPMLKKQKLKHFLPDHCRVLAEILEDVFPRGPSKWKFNSSHLNKSHFINRMNALIAIFLEEANEENLDKQITWELLKATIRTECINYGRGKSQLKYMKGESELEDKMDTLSTQLAQSPNDEKLLHKY